MLSQRAKQICEFRKYTYYDIFCYSRKYNFRDGIKQTFQVLGMTKPTFRSLYYKWYTFHIAIYKDFMQKGSHTRNAFISKTAKIWLITKSHIITLHFQ